MKILVLCEGTDGKNGWNTYARDLRDALASGHDVETLTHAHAFSVLPRALTLLTRPWLARIAAFRLERQLRRIRPDVIHLTVEAYALLIPLLGDAWKQRTVMTIHGTYGVMPLRDRHLLPHAKRYYEDIPRFITVSAYTKQRVEEELAMRVSPAASDSFAERATVIHNGITLPPQPPSRTRNATKQILLVGGVKRRKGILQALRGCAAYRDAGGSPFRFTIAGSTPNNAYTEEVRGEIRRLGLDACVTLAGMIDDAQLEDAYRQADVLLMPSQTDEDSFEGFGLVFLEANAHGVPVIGPADSGTAEAIAEGISGYQVNVDDVAMIADRLSRILEEHAIDPMACRRWAEEHSIRNAATEVEKVYTALLQ